MMNTKTIFVAIAIAALGTVVGSAGILVHANAVRGGAGNGELGATVTKGVKCGGGGQFPPGTTATGQAVVTPSGNANLNCHGVTP
jgi:hypothetical protein